MKMKKTLIAAAVASVCAAPMAAHAVGNVAGEFVGGIENRNDDADGTNDGDTTVELDTAAMAIEGGEDLGNGLRFDTGIAIEVDGNSDDVVRDEVFGTLSGDFGSLTLGWGIDSAYYLHVYEPVDVGIIYDTYTFEGDTATLGSEQDSSSQVIQYGLENGPFSLTAEAVMDDSANSGGDTEAVDRFGIGASFDAGVVTVGVGHESTSNAASGGSEPSQTGVSVSGDVGPAGVAVQYSMYDNDTGGAAGEEPSSVDVVGTMDFGGGLSGALSVGMLDADNGANQDAGDETRFTAQLSQSLSSRTYVFGNLMSKSVDGGSGADSDPQALFVGVGHEF